MKRIGDRRLAEVRREPQTRDSVERRPPPLAVPLAWTGAALFVVSLAWFLYSYAVRFGRPASPGPILYPLLVNIALFSAFALHHSLMARTHLKALVRQWMPLSIERSLYTWVASLLFFAVCWFWQPLPGVVYRLDGVWAFIGYTIQLIGVLLTIRSAAAVDVLDLAGVRAILLARTGRPPAHVPLETQGVYGIVRHPLYLAWALLVFGSPTMTATRFVFAAVSTAYLALAIPFEERNLVEVFGDDYERYRRQVRWRMVPLVY